MLKNVINIMICIYRMIDYSFIEIISFFLYIYFLMYLFIYIKPNFATKSLLFIYSIFTTFNILILCNYSSINKNIVTFLFTFIYSLFCVYCYIVFHKMYHKYIKKHTIIKFSLIFLPFVYIINLKILEKIFQCDSLGAISRIN